MAQRPTQTPLNEFDLMMIRAGYRTDAELEDMARNGFGFTVLNSACALLADGLYRLVVLLEVGARRSADASHLRLTTNSAT